MPDTTPIPDLLRVPQAERELEWLTQALQAAARLEFATLPPYLCAMWSIKSGDGRAYDHLREVVMEEMLHLGLVNNMLTTLGDTPRLFPDAAPAYPCKLPGGVRPNLVVPLRGLTREGLRNVFMEIEKPQHDISGLDPTVETDRTIGDFYDAVLKVFYTLPPGSITGQRQLAKMLYIRDGVKANLFKIETVEDVAKAIKTIKEQGEGTSTSPLDSSKGVVMDLAHYFRFAELDQGKEIEFDDMGRIVFTGPDIPFPDTYPMAEVPPGGYAETAVPAAVAANLKAFDEAYTNMLKELQAAWEPNPADPVQAQPGKLSASIGAMYEMSGLAAEIMSNEITAGGPHYGPCFRIVG